MDSTTFSSFQMYLYIKIQWLCHHCLCSGRWDYTVANLSYRIICSHSHDSVSGISGNSWPDALRVQLWLVLVLLVTGTLSTGRCNGKASARQSSVICL